MSEIPTEIIKTEIIQRQPVNIDINHPLNINQEGGVDIPGLVNSLKDKAEQFFSTIKGQTSGMQSKVKDMIDTKLPAIKNLVQTIPGEFGSVKETLTNVVDKVGNIDGLMGTVKTALEDSLKGKMDGLIGTVKTKLEDSLKDFVNTKLQGLGLRTDATPGYSEPGVVSGETMGGSGEDQFIIDECAKKVRSMILRDLRKSGYRITKKRRNKRSRSRTTRRR